jgi:hypothetical protein
VTDDHVAAVDHLTQRGAPRRQARPLVHALAGAGEVGRDGIVAEPLELGPETIPAPGTVEPAVDQDEPHVTCSASTQRDGEDDGDDRRQEAGDEQRHHRRQHTTQTPLELGGHPVLEALEPQLHGREPQIHAGLELREIVPRRHIGPSHGRQELHQRDPLVITESPPQGLGELQAASLVDRHDFLQLAVHELEEVTSSVTADGAPRQRTFVSQGVRTVRAMQCSNGHDNPDDQKFCGECGELLPPAPAPSTDAEPSERAANAPAAEPGPAPAPRRRRKRTWLVVGAIGFVLIVVIAIASSGSDPSDTVRRASGDTHSSVVGTHTTDAPTTAAPQHEVTIAGNGFTELPPDSIGNSYLSYGVVVSNPSHDIATRVSLNVAFYDANGTVVKADNPSIDVIIPGQTAAYGDTIQAAGATRMEVQALVGDWQTPTTTPGGFTASGVSTTPRDYGGLQTNATLTSTFAKDLKEIVASAIYRDGNGAIVGGDHTYVDFVPAGGSAAVEIQSFSDTPAPAATEVYAQLSTLSLVGS